ncbi:MAG TPA: glutamate--tRNA ligase [Candidatus Doudnabacteria bacterium]|nr:glutamate--tRNA ligase [Candidatus Doudnabacteria bacterium]
MNNLSQSVRTRFAPSPTGEVHIGSIRTALFAFLFARHHNGVNVLRIEDTDQSRKVDGAVENMISVMLKMGIEFDEGVVLQNGKIEQVGDYGPYIQSERLDYYQNHVKQLIEAQKAYYCFCSSERLDELRKEQTALKQPPMYDRLCRKLSADEVAQKLSEFESEEKKPVVRQALPEEGKTVVKDLVYGEISYDHALLDDQVLLKSDGFPTYHLAVVVDDHLMKISHVIRGEEWIPSTPKHILLYQAFGWEAPNFAHLPLILNPDKTKLSKRQGDVAVEDFLAKGYLPEVLLNFVALLGWNPKTEQEIFTKEELVQQFDLEKVNKSGAVFDIEKLNWMNGMYLRERSNEELLKLVSPFLEQGGINIADYPNEFLLAIIEIEKERLKVLSQIVEHTSFYFTQPEYDTAILVWKKADSADAKQKLSVVIEFLNTLSEADFQTTVIEEKLKSWIAKKQFDTGSVLWPLRVSLSGLERSPSPFELISALYKNGGLSTVISRIQTAIDKLN